MSPQRILIVKLSSMGDIIHAWPVAASLRATWPQAEIAWAVERKWLPLVEHHPALDRAIPVDTHAARLSPGAWGPFRRELRHIRAFQAEWTFDLQGSWKSALMTLASGARLRIGGQDAWEPGSGLVLNRRIRTQARHVVERWLEIAAAGGRLERRLAFDFPIPDAAQREVDAWLHDHHIREFAFFSPGGGWPSKRWPTERYAEVADLLQQRHGLAAVLNRGPGESDWNDAYRRASQIRAYLFSGDVIRLGAVLRRARLALGGDTGPMQLAAALGTPTVALFGPTDPARNRPYGPGGAAGVVIRKAGFATTYKRHASFSPAMLAITPAEVAAAAGGLLRQPAAQPVA